MLSLKSLSVLLLSVAVSALPTTLNTAEFSTPVEVRALPTTENGLTGACKLVTVIYARGTNEAGNVGSIAGPPWFSALRSSLTTTNIAVQGVTYSASVGGYLAGGDAAGSTEMTRLINLASTQCPTTKIVLGGYSQGAQLVHNAAKRLTAAVTAKIAAVVVFGDPNNGQAVGTVASSKVLSICHARDVVCTKQGDFTTHLTYGNDAAAASNFVVGKV